MRTIRRRTDAGLCRGLPSSGPDVPGVGRRMTGTTPAGLRIGQLAERLGLNTKTIRYYESIGLLPSPARRPSGYRVYGEDDADRLAFVRTAQRFGLRLDQIREVLAFRDRGERPCDFVLG